MTVWSKIEKCNQCVHHEVHQIYTADSFECDMGIYCSITEDKRDSFERHTHDGYVDRKLVSSDDYDVPIVDIPGWCPLVLKAYEELVDEIVDSDEWQGMMDKIDENRSGSQKLIAQHGRIHAKSVVENAIDFLEKLEKYQFENFYYHSAWCSTQRNQWLVSIAAMLHDIGLAKDTTTDHAVVSAEDAKKYFLNRAMIDDVDKGIIVKAITSRSNGRALVDEAEQTLRVKRDGKYKRKACLETELVVPVALILADKLDITRERIKDEYLNSIGEDPEFDDFCEAVKKISKVEFKFIDPGEDGEGNPLSVKKAELHYVVDDGFNFNAMKFWPSFIRVPRMVAKDILGLRSFAVFVNGVRKNISDF